MKRRRIDNGHLLIEAYLFMEYTDINQLPGVPYYCSSHSWVDLVFLVNINIFQILPVTENHAVDDSCMIMQYTSPTAYASSYLCGGGLL